jgi:hypothetical protein
VRQVGDALVGDMAEARPLEQIGGRECRRVARTRPQEAEAPFATPRTARNRLSRTDRSRNSSDDW